MTDFMLHPTTGDRLTRQVRETTATLRGKEVTMEIEGWWPESGQGEPIFMGDDMAPIVQEVERMEAAEKKPKSFDL